MNFTLKRATNGRYAKKHSFVKGLAIIGLVAFVGAKTIEAKTEVNQFHLEYPVAQESAGENTGEAQNLAGGKDVVLPCPKGVNGVYDCTEDHQIWLKWQKFLKDTTGPVGILRRVCAAQGLHGDECPKTLYAMALQESVFGKYMVGDNGQSHGYFHIMFYHNVPKSCSHDLECSAKWTLARMIRFSYKTNPNYAIQKHNGTPGIPATVKYLAAINAKKANWPGN